MSSVVALGDCCCGTACQNEEFYQAKAKSVVASGCHGVFAPLTYEDGVSDFPTRRYLVKTDHWEFDYLGPELMDGSHELLHGWWESVTTYNAQTCELFTYKETSSCTGLLYQQTREDDCSVTIYSNPDYGGPDSPLNEQGFCMNAGGGDIHYGAIFGEPSVSSNTPVGSPTISDEVYTAVFTDELSYPGGGPITANATHTITLSSPVDIADVMTTLEAMLDAVSMYDEVTTYGMIDCFGTSDYQFGYCVHSGKVPEVHLRRDADDDCSGDLKIYAGGDGFCDGKLALNFPMGYDGPGTDPCVDSITDYPTNALAFKIVSPGGVDSPAYVTIKRTLVCFGVESCRFTTSLTYGPTGEDPVRGDPVCIEAHDALDISVEVLFDPNDISTTFGEEWIAHLSPVTPPTDCCPEDP